MGRRARVRGVTGQALRAAQRALTEKERAASQIAQGVYNACVEWRREDGPVTVMGPLTVASESSAPFVAKQLNLSMDEETVTDVAAMLTYGWLEMIAKLTPEDYQRWKEHADAREAAASTQGGMDDLARGGDSAGGGSTHEGSEPGEQHPAPPS